MYKKMWNRTPWRKKREKAPLVTGPHGSNKKPTSWLRRVWARECGRKGIRGGSMGGGISRRGGEERRDGGGGGGVGELWMG